MFCEVKYRADERKGSPLEAVDARKQQKIFRTANVLSDRTAAGGCAVQI